jgi:hexokinase
MSQIHLPYQSQTLIYTSRDESPNLSRVVAALQKHHPLPRLPSSNDLRFVRQVCQLVSRRAAAYLATSIHALWSMRAAAENLTLSTADPVTIGCNGSVIERYPLFRSTCQSYLDELIELSGAHPQSVVLEIAVESAIFGAAVAVCCLEGQ